ncbi:MAG: site-2 protease family protein [Defluviitaleaceae bacterium]|nr:site-2 protease family protein [Defluviitaleaceae bacterium]
MAMFLYSIPGVIIAVTASEYAKSAAAYRLGDVNIKGQGRLSLNPAKHMDILGSFFMAFFGYGWGNPVRINAFAFGEKRKKALYIVFFVPFLVNMLLGLIFAIGARFWFNGNFPEAGIMDTAQFHVMQILITTARLNIAFALFNLIPIYPLNGTMLLSNISPSASLKMAQAERILQIVLAFFIIFGIMGFIFHQPTTTILRFFMF